MVTWEDVKARLAGQVGRLTALAVRQHGYNPGEGAVIDSVLSYARAAGWTPDEALTHRSLLLSRCYEHDSRQPNDDDDDV